MTGLRKSERSHKARRSPTLIGVAAVLVLMPVGQATPGPGTPTSVAWYSRPVVLFGSGTLTTPNRTSKAITYDTDLAPIGAAMTGTVIPTSEGSMAQLTVFGLLPNRGYAVYAYANACGASAGAAGRRFQNHLDPTATSQNPSSDPRYANPDNEIWLDVRTDIAGTGTSHTTVPYTLSDRVPGSLVVHDVVQTPAGPSEPRKAGDRIACLTLSRQ